MIPIPTRIVCIAIEGIVGDQPAIEVDLALSECRDKNKDRRYDQKMKTIHAD